jgi:hypothetical protein
MFKSNHLECGYLFPATAYFWRPKEPRYWPSGEKAMPKVTIYIRNHKTREYEQANPKTKYPPDTIWCLRYEKDGKSKWETLVNKTHVPGYGMTYSLPRAIANLTSFCPKRKSLSCKPCS